MLDYLYRIKKKKRVKRYLFVLFLSAEKNKDTARSKDEEKDKEKN